MKNILSFLFLFVCLSGFSQKQNFLYSIFYGEISKDEFLISQKYSDILCEGTVFRADGTDKKVDLEDWVYNQDFKKYLDTTIYDVYYKTITTSHQVKLESIKIYKKNTMEPVRVFLNSYSPNSHLMTSLNDSDLDI